MLTDQQLEDLVSRLPLLESLCLKNCYRLKLIKIRHQHLKDLEFHLLDSVLQATFYTPSLLLLRYFGYSMFKISLKAPNLLLADIKICRGSEITTHCDIEWYTRLIEFLSKFNSTKKVPIFCGCDKVYIYIYIYKDLHYIRGWILSRSWKKADKSRFLLVTIYL